MKRKDYSKPTMRVVELRHRTMLLAGSNPDVHGGASLGSSWNNGGGDAWSGGSGSGGSSMGGWTDSGGDAWE